MAAMFRYAPHNAVRFRFRVSRYGSRVGVVVLGQSCRRTSDACDVAERGVDHVAVLGLKTFHQLDAHHAHERRSLIATPGFPEREFSSMQCCVAVVAERHQVVRTVRAAVLALDDVVDLKARS